MSTPTLTPLDSLLIANRGEIAARVARSARARGLRVVMVFTEADRGAAHTRAGDLALAVGDYLDGPALVALARGLPGLVGVHPGYGFLAERADFARQVQDAGLVWVGPPPEAIAAMGDKAAARRRVAGHGVPVVPGYDGEQQEDEVLAVQGGRVGYPLLVKAAAGGGGKGMQVVREPGALPEALAQARRLALGAFGDDRLVLERYLCPARHVEVQVLADAHGACLHLLERECSLQRRHQKVIEEAPAPNLSDAQRAALYRDAVQAARAVGYQGAGTVEFILGPDGQHHFLEMNTRLQVEHPVTEAVTGLDLVDLQLHVAEGRPLPLTQAQVAARGWSIEARLYAEDAAQGWLPSAGPVLAWRPPGDLRVDAGVETGSVVGTRYDPLLAKVIAWGQDREQARRRLEMGLRRLVALGPVTSRGALIALLEDPRFVAGQLSTTLLDGWTPPPVAADWLALCGLVAHEQLALRARLDLPEVPPGWRNNRWRDPEVVLEVQGTLHRLRWRERSPGHLRVHRAPEAEVVPFEPTAWSEVRARPVDGALEVEVDGRVERLIVVDHGEWRLVHRPEGDLRVRVVPPFVAPGQEAPAGGLVAPMTGVVVQVAVAAGQAVTQGQVLVLLEAMKMEQAVRAPHDGVVAEVRVATGQQVDAGMLLVVLEAGDAD